MPKLAPEHYRAAIGLGLLAATGLLGFGVERLARGAFLLGGSSTALGLGLAVLVLTFEIEGDPSRQTVLLFTREECPHCDEARAILTHLQDDLGFDLWEVDITGDEQLTQAYGTDVPVVIVDQRRVASLEVREEQIRRELAGERSDAARGSTSEQAG